MADIASTLKAEIARVARKQIRAEIEPLRKASSQYKSTIAALRKKVDLLEKQLKRVAKGGRASRVENSRDVSERPRQVRFSSGRLAAHRTKLGVSAAEYGKLVGVSGQSIYAWEQGKTRPRVAQLQALAAVRGLGKRGIAELLAAP